MTRTLVTGGCGFAGRHFVKALLERGHRLTVVDDLSSGVHPDAWHRQFDEAKSSPGLEFIEGDVRGYVREADPDFDLIVHLAAVVGGRLTIEGDPLLVATDLAVDADFFNWVVRGDASPKVIYFSSSAAYPTSAQTREAPRPLAESLIDFDSARIGVPDMTYGWSKLTGEFLAAHAARTYGLRVACYRPFSGYGEDQDLTYPFPSIVQRVARGDDPVVVWGSGEQERDFIHIDDVVEAVLGTYEGLAPGEAMNLGSGEATSFSSLARLACEIAGHDAEVVTDETKPEGVFSRVADVTRMRAAYEPAVTLAEGVARALEYQSGALRLASRAGAPPR